MSMGMHIVGIPERKYFDKMIEVKELCEKHNVSLPEEVLKFFGDLVDENTDCLESEILLQDIPHRKYGSDMQEGFEVDVDSIPESIKTIRFYCSW